MSSQKTKRPSSGKGSGQRRHFRGKMVRADGSPRSHTAAKSPAAAGFSVDDTHDKSFGRSGIGSGAAGLGKYKVAMPKGRARYVRPSL